MREHARRQAAELLRRLAYQVARASRREDAETIHDLRVAARRFAECLRSFDQFFTGRRVRRQVKRLMQVAASVRDRDIALALLAAAGAEQGEAAAELRARRRVARREMQAYLGQWLRRDLARKWRQRLEL